MEFLDSVDSSAKALSGAMQLGVSFSAGSTNGYSNLTLRMHITGFSGDG